MIKPIAPATDPCWTDAEYRTARLRGLIALYGLTGADIQRLTGHSKDSVHHWMSGKHRSIPPAVLRCLMYDLLSAQHAQQK